FEEENTEVILLNADSEEILNKGELIEELDIKTHNASIIAYSAQIKSDPTYTVKIIELGAKFILNHPFVAEEVVAVVNKAFNFALKKRTYLDKIQGEQEARVLESKTYTIFSTKGGVGRTLFSVNLAIAIKKVTGLKVAVIDLNLQFGDVAIMMNIKPKRTLVDLIKEITQAGSTEIDMETFMSYYIEHESGVNVLSAPIRPEESELVHPEHIEAILKKSSEYFHYIVIDTPNYLSETMLNALIPSDKIIILLTMELPTIKNGKLMLELLQKLNIPKEKLVIIMNRFNPKAQYSIKDIEEMLECQIAAKIESEGLTVIPSVENGEPFMMSKPDSLISKKFTELAQIITGFQVTEEKAADKDKKDKKGKKEEKKK
ncbi:MAG: AAA family ATPase, partial [Candidatus Hydrogenedentota bacterium]